MSNQIQIRWDSDMGDNYDASVAALRSFAPPPDVKVSLSIKGKMTPEQVKGLVKLVEANEDVKVGVLITATWGADAKPEQLRLFPPGSSGSPTTGGYRTHDERGLRRPGHPKAGELNWRRRRRSGLTASQPSTTPTPA